MPRPELPNVPSWKPTSVHAAGFRVCSGRPLVAWQGWSTTRLGRWLLLRPVPETRFVRPGMLPVNTVTGRPEDAWAIAATSQPPRTFMAKADLSSSSGRTRTRLELKICLRWVKVRPRKHIFNSSLDLVLPELEDKSA